MTSTKIGGRAALTDRDQMIIKSDPLLARLYEIEAPHPELRTPAPAEAEPVSAPALTEAKPVSIFPNERKVRAQKIREQAAQQRAQDKHFKAVRGAQAKQFKVVRVIERSLFSMCVTGASSKDIATYLRVVADQLEQDE